ncbi:MAG TPA: (d)CMP kinase [Gemmatimonadaceae bacterium]|nr:(d)CMP kinase [Gemmatimonadaceae bacterium]
MTRRHRVIAIDGPAASGKSSTAQWVARRLGFHHVDSGALYRAATAAQLLRSRDVDHWTEAAVVEAARSVTFVARSGAFVPLLHDEPNESELRGADVTRAVSRVAAMPSVRKWVNEHVRRTADSHDVVVDGRDIGTVVFPDADLKLFLIADPWERARRRLMQRLGRHPTDDEIAEETDHIVHRDARDATQTVQANDAVLIDTTYLTQEDQVERIVALAKAVTHRPDATSNVDG